MMKTKTTDKRRRILIAILIATLAFIWGNSLFDSQSSSEESRFIVRILEMFCGTGNVSEHFIRKLAHFGEYTILGIELYLLLGKYFQSAAYGLMVALVDETIQLFVQRGSSVLDVWLDFSGVLSGALLALIIIRIITAKKNKQINNSKNDKQGC